MFSGILKRFSVNLYLALGLGLILFTSGRLIFGPAIHIDEGYYLGASRAVLGGDVLLRQYGFDKPFLLPFWPLPGLLLFGVTPLGFHLTALISYLTAFVQFFKLLNLRLSSPSLSFGLSSILFLLPTFQQHGISNFCEPYLILLAVLLLRGVLESWNEKWLSLLFFAGVFTKYSFVLYFPILIPAIKKGGLKGFLNHSKWIFIGALVCMISNPIKFGSLTWFSHFVNDSQSLDFIPRVLNRLVEIGQTFYSLPILFLAVTLTPLMIWRSIRVKDPFEIGLTAITLVHLFTFLLMSARFYPRYGVQWLPSLFLSTAFGLGFLLKKWSRKRIWDGVIFATLMIFLLPLIKDKDQVEPDIELGREMYTFSSEAEHPGSLIHNDYLWQSAPFRTSSFNIGCTEDPCILEKRRSHPLFTDSFVFKEGKLLRLPLWTGDSLQLKSEIISLQYPTRELAQKALGQLKLAKAFSITQVALDKSAKPTPRGSIFLTDHIRLKALSHRSLLGKKIEIELSMTLGLNEYHRLGEDFPAPVPQWVARIDGFKILGHESVDILLPLFFRGYTVGLDSLGLVQERNIRYTLVGLDEQELKIQKEIVQR